MRDEMDYSTFHEAYHEYGEIRCEGCSEPIDLSDADDTDGAIDIWNEHVRSEHPENAPNGDTDTTGE
jgi:hypothetical protein